MESLTIRQVTPLFPRGNRSRDSQARLLESRFLGYILRVAVTFTNRKAAMNMAGPRRCVVDARVSSEAQGAKVRSLAEALVLCRLVADNQSFSYARRMPRSGGTMRFVGVAWQAEVI